MDKTCTACLVPKPLDEFYRHRRLPDGRASRCKACAREYERSAVGRAARHRYETGDKGHAKSGRYRRSDKARQTKKVWKKTEVGRAAKLRYRHSESNRRAQKKYRDNNPEVYLAISRRSMKSEKTRARMRAYRESGKRLLVQSKYKGSPKGKLNSAMDQSIRRARRASAGGSYTVAEWLALCGASGNACLACGSPGPLEPDHVVAIARGGNSYISNIQPLCRRCNQRKGTKSTDYRQKGAA